MFKKLLCLSLLLLPVAAFAQTGTPKDKATMQTTINTNLPDQTTGAITPAILRNTLSDMLASWQQYATVNTQTGTSYTIVTTDYGKLVTFNNGSPVAVTLPAASGSFANFSVFVTNKGAGGVTITPASGTVGGSSSLNMGQNQSNMLVAAGGNWEVFRGADGVGSGGTGTPTPPGGASGNIQFNNAGTFGGLTDTQLTTHINTFGSLKGAVPASTGGTTNFLRADGVWAAPPGGGSGGAPGGANGNIQYNSGGSFAGLTDTQVTARLDTFTSGAKGLVPASGGGSANFLRADGSWAAPPTGGGGGGGTITGGPPNNQWWETAVTARFGDRLMVGDAYYHHTGTSGAGADWWTNFECTRAPSNGCGSYINYANLIVGSTQSNQSMLALMAYQQTLYAGNNGAAAIAITAMGLLNSTSFNTYQWAYYGECNVTVAKPIDQYGCTAMEIEAANYVDDAHAGMPDGSAWQSNTYGLNIGCGSGTTNPQNYDCGGAISIGANPRNWKVGLRIANGIAVGAAGVPNAIALAATYRIGWWLGDGNLGSSVFMGGSGNLNFQTQGVLVIDGTQGVSCSGGINSSTFRSVKGLVTSC